MLQAKRPQSRRVLDIDREIRLGRYPTAQKLAEITEATSRTIQRDLNFMRDDLGAPIEYCPKEKGFYYTAPMYQLPHTKLSEGELVALFLAERMLEQHRGLPYEAELKRAVHKLAELLPSEISIRWEAVEQAHSFRSSVVSLRDVDIFRQLAEAVLHHKQLRITYYTASRDTEGSRVVDPWHLTNVDGEWYLIGFCHVRRSRRMFAPGRIRKLEFTGHSFAIPDDFSIGEFLDGTFKVIREDGQPVQTIRLCFAPSAAKYVKEKIWHASQILKQLQDGSVIVEFSLRSLIEVRRWILSWGAECEVLAPPELREDIAQQGRVLASRSGPAPKASSARRKPR